MLLQLLVPLHRQTDEVKQLKAKQYGVYHHYRNRSYDVFQRR